MPVSVFAYASPTFRLREAYAGGKYIFRISESKMKQKLCKHNWETGSPSGTVYRLLPQTFGFSSCIILIYGDCLRKVSLLHTMIASSCSLLHALDPKAKDSVRIRRLRGDCQNITHKKCLRGPTPPSSMPTSNYIQINSCINHYMAKKNATQVCIDRAPWKSTIRLGLLVETQNPG